MFIVAVACVTCEAVCDLLGPTLMAHIIDTGIEQGQLSAITYWGGLMLIVTAVGAGFAVTRSILASRVSQRVGADLRFDLFSKIMSLSETGADEIESGSLITRMTNDTTQVVQFVNGLMRIFLKAPITCIGSIVLASILNFKLSIVIYIVVAVTGLLIYISMKLSYPRFTLLQQAMDRVNTIVQEYLIGVRLVKAFGTYEEESDRFFAANDNLREKGVRSQRVITITGPLITLSVGLGTVFAIYFGGRLFPLGQIQPGNISAFVIYMAQMLSSLMMITNIFNTFVRTRASTARISQVLDCEDDFSGAGDSTGAGAREGAGEGAEEDTVDDGSIEFSHVTFNYQGGSGVPAVKDISFSVAAGESLAVIGPTGSGKSTLCWLLLRFYDTGSGSIMIGGKDIRNLPVDEVRKNIAIVPQNPMLFSGSVEENIKWGDPQATDDAVRLVAQEAQAGFIDEMPQGFESILGSAAVNISGGQKQRISIARGLLKRAPILILDDATSALDAITESKLRRDLLRKDRKQTIVLVTQRCTTAMFADKILVLENGVCTGLGTHEELMESSETYRELYRSQVDSGVRV